MKKLIALALILALALPVLAFADEPTDAICGRWCFYWDTQPMNDEYNGGKPMMSFIVNNYDLYLYADGSAYLVAASIDKNGRFKLNYPASEGVWLANGTDDIRISVLGGPYKACLDEDGRLLVYMAKDIPYPFVRIPSYDFMKETAN